jgi:hypothetical protein
MRKMLMLILLALAVPIHAVDRELRTEVSEWPAKKPCLARRRGNAGLVDGRPRAVLHHRERFGFGAGHGKQRATHRVAPKVFELPPVGTLNAVYAPLPDRERFLVVKRTDTSQGYVANVVLNWPALRR